MGIDQTADYAHADAQERFIEQVSRYVQQNPGATRDQVIAGIPAIPGATSMALERLRRAGFVERDSDGRYRSVMRFPLSRVAA